MGYSDVMGTEILLVGGVVLGWQVRFPVYPVDLLVVWYFDCIWFLILCGKLSVPGKRLVYYAFDERNSQL